MNIEHKTCRIQTLSTIRIINETIAYFSLNNTDKQSWALAKMIST